MLRAATTLSIACLLVATACSGDGPSPYEPPRDGRVNLEFTDAPLPLGQIARAIVQIDEVAVHGDVDGDHGFVTVIEGGPYEIKLHGLRNGLTQFFEGDVIPPGTYRQLRIHFTSALLELKDGRVFTTEDGTLDLTGQDTAGFKVFFDPPLVVREDGATNVLLDFDLRKTFSSVPGNDTANATSFHLHPSVRTAVLDETGEIRGVVTTKDGAAMVPAPDAEVYVLAPGEEDLDQAFASTLADANGSAAVLGIPPGTYDVVVIHDGLTDRAENLVVTQGAITSFEIELK